MSTLDQRLLTEPKALTIGSERRNTASGCRKWVYQAIPASIVVVIFFFACWQFAYVSRDVVCESDLDCELNGVCKTGQCSCDKGWQGPTCSRLALKPSKVHNGYRQENVATWGGNVVEDSAKSSGKFHLFAAEMLGHCGLKSWITNSQVMHATADRKEGPYARKATALPNWSHNPQIATAPDGTFLLFHIGKADGSKPVVQCQGRGTTPAKCDQADLDLEVALENGKLSQNRSGPRYTFPVHFSESLDGPWTSIDLPIDFSVGSNANPAPIILANGTVLILFNSHNMALAQADHWRGPYRLRTTGACGKGEDPFLYVDKRGHFHCLAHAAPFNQPTKSIVHSYSLDGFSWNVSGSVAGGSKIEFDNGQTVLFSKRERPKLLFDDDHELSHLITGVTLTPECAPGFLYPSLGNKTVAQLPKSCSDSVHQYDLTDHNPCPGNYDLAFTHIQEFL